MADVHPDAVDTQKVLQPIEIMRRILHCRCSQTPAKRIAIDSENGMYNNRKDFLDLPNRATLEQYLQLLQLVKQW